MKTPKWMTQLKERLSPNRPGPEAAPAPAAEGHRLTEYSPIPQREELPTKARPKRPQLATVERSDRVGGVAAKTEGSSRVIELREVSLGDLAATSRTVDGAQLEQSATDLPPNTRTTIHLRHVPASVLAPPQNPNVRTPHPTVPPLSQTADRKPAEIERETRERQVDRDPKRHAFHGPGVGRANRDARSITDHTR